MILPVIKNLPVHTLHLKVMNKTITFTPFNVAQEKGIVSATSDDNSTDIINNYLAIAKECIIEELDWSKISLIDFMTIAIIMRAKSQGEVLSFEKKECKICKKSYPFEVNIEDSLIFENEQNFKEIVKIDENLSIEVKPLDINYLYDFDKLTEEIDIYISMIAHSINKIFFKNEIYTNLCCEEIKTNCINNLTKFQLKKIIESIEKLIS